MLLELFTATLLSLSLLHATYLAGLWGTPTITTVGTTNPHVQLDQASVLGTVNGKVESFLGISYAKPPIGDLRLRLPQPIDSYDGTVNATVFGNQCFQQQGKMPESKVPPEVVDALLSYYGRFAPDPNVPESEDCLNVNVIRPANTSVDAKLPVLFWIYGGGFAVGSNATPLHNGSAIVQRSIELGQPVIFVAVNYRVSVFGFLGGAEVKEAGVGNLGLQDQRAALRWVNKYISSFGGDPDQVTIWGESAGSASVFFQLFANRGDNEGLFRAAIMSSDIIELQGTYDVVVDHVGCSDATDTLVCLRTVPSDSLLAAINNIPSTGDIALPSMPRADGLFIQDHPQRLAHYGKMADVPFIIGDVKDEGTIFSLGADAFNATTDDEFAHYVSKFWFPGSTLADLEKLLKLYPSDPAAGSPFDTGSANALTPQYKRFSALQGDWFFDAPRRQLLNRFSYRHNTYNFQSARVNVPALGYLHGHDLFAAFNPDDMTDYFIRFVTTLNPNGDTGIEWPSYDTTARATLQFNEGAERLKIAADDERMAAMNELTSLSLRFPF